MGYFPLNGANHGLSLLLGGKFGIKLCLKDSSKCLSSLFGQNKKLNVTQNDINKVVYFLLLNPLCHSKSYGDG